MKKKKIIIIGAGIAGLAAGIYLQKNGYHTEIFEMSKNPGGLCTGWERKGYTFDGCIHWVTDSEPGRNLYHFWEETGVAEGLDYITFDVVRVVEDEEGTQCKFYSDPDKLKTELISFGPEDKELVEDLTETIRQNSMMTYDTSKASELMTFFERLRMMTQMGPFIKFLDKWDIPMLEYANKYKNPFLRKVFLSFGEEITYMSFFAIIFMMGSYAGKSGYPIGGSLAFAKKMEEKYLSLGGKVNYNSRVEKIIVENNSASGILLEDGNSHKSDMVISAADGYSTIFNMLEGKYINNKIKSYYEGALKPFPAIIQLSLGVKREFKDQEHALSIPLQERIKVDPANSLERLTIKFYNFDPTLAPKGCTSVVTFFTADHSYWADLRKNDRQKYNAEKKRITDEIIKELDQRFPGLAEDVEVTDLATPATYIRYTNNWKGSFEGWLIDRKSMMLQINKQLPGLKNFYMIGQWVSPGGGLPSGVTTGRDVTQIICRKDKKEFKVD